jgi:hypothetical protein
MNSEELLYELIEKSLSGYVYDMAAVVQVVYKDKYVCSKIKSRQWFTFDGLKWCYTEIGPYHDISINFVAMYDNMLSCELVKSEDFQKSTEEGATALTRSQLNDWELCKKKIVRLYAVISKLKNVTFKENVCREAMYLFYNPDFLSKLDSERHLVCFCNGILDTRSQVFRQGTKDDYVSVYIDEEYMPTRSERYLFRIEKFITFRENVISKRKGSQFKFTIGDLTI